MILKASADRQRFHRFQSYWESGSKRGLGGVELCEYLTDRNSAADQVAIDATSNLFTLKIMNPKHRVAAPMFIEPFVLRCITERVDEHGYETGRSRNNFIVNKRTACKIFAAHSARVFAEMQPHRSIGPFCFGQSSVVVHIPVN